MDEEKVLENYLELFNELPPQDMIISYYDDLYQDLMKKAIENNKPITAEDLEMAIGEQPYDVIFDDNKEGAKMEEKDIKKIKELLNKYGAEESEIENFITDLADVKEDLEEDKQDQELEKQEPVNTEKEVEEKDENEDYLFNQKNMEILKATEDGKRLIINAPRMAKDELERAIKKLLG